MTYPRQLFDIRHISARSQQFGKKPKETSLINPPPFQQHASCQPPITPLTKSSSFVLSPRLPPHSYCVGSHSDHCYWRLLRRSNCANKKLIFDCYHPQNGNGGELIAESSHRKDRYFGTIFSSTGLDWRDWAVPSRSMHLISGRRATCER
jgi:hypothetical protein